MLKSKVIAVTSVKGGVGKTITTLSLASILSNKKIKTIIVDMDLHFGAISTSLNLKNGKDIYILVNDLMNHTFTQIDDYVIRYNDYIDVLAAPSDPRSVGKISSSYIDVILKKLKYKYDVVLIDTNHIIDNINLITLDNTDSIIHVITDDLIDLKNMKTMIAIYKDMNLKKYKILFNESLSNKYLSVDEVSSFLNTNVDYVLPKSFYIKNINKYLLKGNIMEVFKGKTVLDKIIEDLL